MTRLDPMPTDTALARWVARMVARWPMVLRSTHAAKVASLNWEIREQRMVNDTIRRDMARIMRPRFPSMLDLGVGDVTSEAMMCEQVTEFTVRFQPIRYRLEERRLRIARETDYVMREVARDIVHHHARQYEKELMRMMASAYFTDKSPGARRRGYRDVN